jgi:glycyl-tRNA synthetase
MSDAKTKETPLMEKITSLCKRRGFIFQSSEIYGGIGGFWDYGPLGAELKRNLREAWWTAMTRDREDVLGLDATIIMHPAIWVASGHVATFADMMRECSVSNKRVRADHVPAQEGTEYSYSGVESAATGWKQERTLSILLPKGGHPESARKQARAWYAAGFSAEVTGKVEELKLLGETTRVHDGTVDFHPETGGLLREARPFNLMLKTYVGPTATEDDIAYLRPETAQAIFAQFKNVLDSSRIKVPFGICQIGKAFRNEVTPKNFTFRSREFEQMELEFFIKPDEAIEIVCGSVAQWSESADLSTPQDNWGWDLWHRYWVKERTQFYRSIGLGDNVLDYHWQTREELAHYARACVDILFKFPFGTDELEGIAARGEFDLSQHQKHSGKPMEYFDEELKAAAAKLDEAKKEEMIGRRLAAEAAKEKGGLTEAEVRAWFERLCRGFYVPHVIEPSAGLDRLALAVICAAFAEEEKADVNGKVELRTFLRFHPRIAPVKVGVFPLLKNKPDLVAKAREVYAKLKRHFHCFYDETAAIGRRYARQDEIGTPFGVTIDFETLGEKGPELQDTVTLRERDSGAQIRVKINDLPAVLAEKLG